MIGQQMQKTSNNQQTRTRQQNAMVELQYACRLEAGVKVIAAAPESGSVAQPLFELNLGQSETKADWNTGRVLFL
jgi:hypothetical protein